MARNIKKEVKKFKDVNYTNKDFESLRADLRRFAGVHFPNVIVDTSDASLTGLLIDLVAYVGDSMSYYLDHQFNENSLERAVEIENIERFVREAGVEIRGASPAIAPVKISIIVPATSVTGEFLPNRSYLPKIKKQSIFNSIPGIKFYLLDDIDFAEEDPDGELKAEIEVNQSSGGRPTNFVVTKTGFVTSAETKEEKFAIENSFRPFRKITLSNENIHEIVSVKDTDGDEYHEVESLTQSTVFERMPNTRVDAEQSPERLRMKHAPKRFIRERSASTGLTSLRFGSGNENVFDEDIIPDPSDHAIRLFGDKKTLNKITIDPNSFLETQTLGISPTNTTLTVRYRSGGGLNHNVGVSQINSVNTLITTFKGSVPTSVAASIRATLGVINPSPASGGEDEPTIEELRSIALLNKNSQNRIVTREDLIARVYSIPSNFGRVFRTSVRDNPNNPQAAELYVISRDRFGKLALSSDTLKTSLSRYLSKFRLVSDAIDILDAQIINIGVRYKVTIDPTANGEVVLASINSKISEYLSTKNAHIDQPINIGEIENMILNTHDVRNIVNINFFGRFGVQDGNVYAGSGFNPTRNIDRGYLFPPRGGIFELKYPEQDVIGRIS